MKKIKIFTSILFIFTIFLWVSFWATKTWWTNITDEVFVSLQKLLNLLFIIVRPFLIIAGKFLSNSFVYGSSFFIDTALWKVWQLVRTWMNYFIWIIFIISILIYFFKSNSKLSISQIFPKIVFSAVIVNMSWFLFAVLLDISTILLVGAWWIWEQFNTMIGQATDRDPQKDTVLLPVTINTDSKGAVLQTKVNWKEYNFCLLDENLEPSNKPCIDYRWGVYKLYDWNSSEWKPIPGGITASDLNYSSVGMLFSIFRYMNMAFATDNTNTQKATFWLYVLKIILMLALVIPFILLAVILFIRLMILWVVIPLSPILFWLPILGVFDSKVKDKLTNIVALIFQPAYVVFMLSIWFVLIQSLYTMMPSIWWEKKEKEILKEFNIEKKWNSELELNGILDIKSKFDPKTWTTTKMADYKNLFSYIAWIIANLISIMILWILVFVAFKSNSFTKKIATSVDVFAKQSLKAIPILPWWQSIASLWSVGSHLQRIPNIISEKQSSELMEDTKKMFK